MTFEILCKTCNTLADLLSEQRSLYRSMAMSENMYQVQAIAVIIGVILVVAGIWKDSIVKLFAGRRPKTAGEMSKQAKVMLYPRYTLRCRRNQCLSGLPQAIKIASDQGGDINVKKS